MKNIPHPDLELQAKADVRTESLDLIPKDEVNVLDAFGGEGLVWNQVRTQTKKTVNSLRIDRNKNLSGMYLKGDNMKYLKSLDLAVFDIIDLDAYASPFNQLEVILKRKYAGVVHCSYVLSGIGNINRRMLERLGYTDRMINKAPQLFARQPFSKMVDYLATYGVREITNFQLTDRKNFFYFRV